MCTSLAVTHRKTSFYYKNLKRRWFRAFTGVGALLNSDSSEELEILIISNKNMHIIDINIDEYKGLLTLK